MFSLQLETEGQYYIVALVCLDWKQTLNNYITYKVNLAVKYSSLIPSLHLRRLGWRRIVSSMPGKISSHLLKE
jgi:hypothetical protein